jgi:AraC family transcriptional regulator
MSSRLRGSEPPTRGVWATRRGVVRGHVAAAVGVLRERITGSWPLESLAEEVHLSRSQLVRSFDVTIGLSPMSCLRQMRARRMARLLAITDLSVAETARAVGWADANYASRCFRAQYGVSPTEFRRRQASPSGG